MRRVLWMVAVAAAALAPRAVLARDVEPGTVEIVDSTGASKGTVSNPVVVSGTVTATAAGTQAVTSALQAALYGNPGTPVVVSITGGADASGVIVAGTMYRVVNPNASALAFCKVGGAATLNVDNPHLPMTAETFTYSGSGNLSIHCVLSASTTGVVMFIPMSVP